MKIAILGARGFLGGYLAKHLSRSHQVIPVTRETLDLTDYHAVDSWMKEAKPDVIVNCAISGGGKNVNDINYSDIQRDLTIFLNFYNNENTPRYINIGSGAEFDKRRSISNCEEQEILQFTPLESYGFTKNTIARMVLQRDNFYTLRLFGCFDSSEPDIRVFKKFLKNGHIAVVDKYFDFISAKDFAIIVEHFCQNTVAVKDVNCVYDNKLLLSTQLMRFANYHIPQGTVQVGNTPGLNYTGSGRVLKMLNLPLQGLERGLKEYE